MKHWRIQKKTKDQTTEILKRDWLKYVERDPSLIRFVHTPEYMEEIKRDERLSKVDPDGTIIWFIPNHKYLDDSIHFIFDDHSGLSAFMYVHNSKTVRKILQVARSLAGKVFEDGKVIDYKYLNMVLDKESGPKNEWGDPPFSRNVNDIPEDSPD